MLVLTFSLFARGWIGGGDQTGDETIFDGRNARLISDKVMQQTTHEKLLVRAPPNARFWRLPKSGR
jgi:hypothetical protein